MNRPREQVTTTGAAAAARKRKKIANNEKKKPSGSRLSPWRRPKAGNRPTPLRHIPRFGVNKTINPQSSDVLNVRRTKQGPGILTRMPARAHILGRQWGGSTQQQQQLTPASRRRGKTPRDPGPTQLMSLPPP